MFSAAFDGNVDPKTQKPRGWRVLFDGRDLFGAIDEFTARSTAALMQLSRKDHYR